MDLGISGRVALVAASSQGIGKAVALALAREGCRIVLNGRTLETLTRAAAEIRSAAPCDLVTTTADVALEEGVAAVVRAATDAYGRVDICVTNAGGPPTKPFAETTPGEWRHGVDANFLSAVWFAREVLPGMQRRGWGRFLTITSVSVKQPLDGLIISNAVRAAVNGLVKSLSNEYARYGITVNNVLPGYTATKRLEEFAAGAGPGAMERWAAQIPARRLARPEEIGDAVAFLASERAAYITGEAITIDGGFARSVPA